MRGLRGRRVPEICGFLSCLFVFTKEVADSTHQPPGGPGAKLTSLEGVRE